MSMGRAIVPRLLLLAAIAALLAILGVVPVLAHAQLVSVDPPDGAQLDVPPSEIVLTFNEPVALAPEGVRVLDAAGEPRDDGPEQLVDGQIRQPVGELGDGSYVISWAVVSEDGHILRGSTLFSLQGAEVDPDATTMAPPRTVTTTSAIVGPSRAIADLGILVATGAAAAIWLLGARSRRVLRLMVVAIIVAIVGTIDWMAIEWVDGGSAWLDTAAAQFAFLRLLILVIAVAAAGGLPVATAVALAIATLSLAVGGHSTGLGLATISEAAHLAAAAVWLGAAPAVLLVMWDRDLDDGAALSVVRRFSRVAAGAIIGVAIAGIVLTLQLTSGFAEGVTPWLTTLVLKVGLVLAAVLLGAFGRRSLGRDARRSRFRWLFVVDTAILVGVVILSANLTLSSPGTTQAVAHHEAATPLGSDTPSVTVCESASDASFVLLEADPGRSGANEFEVRNLDAAESVAVDMAHATIEGAPLRVELAPDGDVWQASAIVPFAGAWSATVVARVDRFTEVRWTCRLVIGD